MPTRIFAAVVVLFWLVSTGWLVRSIWFSGPDEAEPVALEEALGAFFRWNDQTNLTVLENGIEIGQMGVSGNEGFDARLGRVIRGFSTTGTLDEPVMDREGPSPVMGLTWRMNADFGEGKSEWERMETVLRVPRQSIHVRLEVAGDPPALAARLEVAGSVVYETGALRGGDGSVAPKNGAAPVPAAVPFPLPGGAGLLADAEGWRPKMTAARGTIRAAGRGLPVFVIDVRLGDGAGESPDIRLYLSEAGEPLKIETAWGFEAIAEVLIPVNGARN